MTAQTGGTTPRLGRPAAVWPSGPLEVIAAFEHPVEPDRANALVGQTITYFDVDSNNREKRPAPQNGPVGTLRIVGVRSSLAGRTLTLATDPHPRVARYVLPLDASDPLAPSKAPRTEGVSYDLGGLEWGWLPAAADAGEEPRSKGWWPSLDLETTRRETKGSRPHEQCLALLDQPGRMVFNSLLMLPEGPATVRVESSGPIEEAIAGDVQGEPKAATGAGLNSVELAIESKTEPLFLSVTVKTGPGNAPFQLKAAYRPAGEKVDKVLSRKQLLVPWAPVPPAAAAAGAPLIVPDLSGGDAARGQALFSGDAARCSQCHTFRGQGGKVGPDLTEIGRKGAAEIYRNIAAPSANIEPDYTSYTVATTDGKIAVGIVRAEGAGAIRVTDTNAKSTVILRNQIGQIRPSANSIMPVGLAATLGDAAIRDLIAYLSNKQ